MIPIFSLVKIRESMEKYNVDKQRNVSRRE